jgi:hypothetical protein
MLCCVFVGCANEEAAPPFEVIYDESWTPEGNLAVYNATELWNKRVGEELFFEGSADTQGECNVIHVKFVDVIEVGRTSIGRYIKEGCNFVLKLAPAGVKDHTTVEHELGHILGLDDGDEPESVMFWTTTRWETTITAQNVTDVRSYWGF